MLAFAGAHAIATCPSGPQVKTFVGRKDSSTPAPNGLLPDVHASGDSLFALFQDKGFDAVDLAALVGAHTTSKQFFVDTTQAGKPQDSTPGIWDVKFYGETVQNPPPAGNFRFPSDLNLANQAQVGKEFKGFVNNQGYKPISQIINRYKKEFMLTPFSGNGMANLLTQWSECFFLVCQEARQI
jgi:L-ascorbate peroxidase